MTSTIIEDDERVYIDESDIIHEIILDDEDLPDFDEESILDDDLDAISEDDQHDYNRSDGFEDLGDFEYTFCRHVGELYAVACRPIDVNVVATGGQDHLCFIWKIGEVDQVTKLDGHGNSVSCLAFSHDGQLLASGDVDGVVRIWDTLGNQKHEFQSTFCDSECEWVCWHPKGHLVSAGLTEGIVQLWNADKGALLATFYSQWGSTICGDFTPDGHAVCIGFEDGTLAMWNPRSNVTIHNKICFAGSSTNSLSCMILCSDSTFALIGSIDGSAYIVNLTSVEVVIVLHGHEGPINCVGLAQISTLSWAATGGSDRKLIIWDLKHSSSPRCTCYHEGSVICLAWLGLSSPYVAAGCSDGKIVIWDSRSGVCIRTLRSHSKSVQSLSLTLDHQFLLSVSFDGNAKVFKVSDLR